MEQIKIKKVISLNGKIKEFTNPILNDQYSFEENEEGIKVIGNMNLVGEVLYDNDVKEKIDEAFLIEFYIFNEQIDYTLIKLLSYDIKVDENRLIIKMVFSKEKKVIEKENMDEDIDKIDNICNEKLITNGAQFNVFPAKKSIISNNVFKGTTSKLIVGFTNGGCITNNNIYVTNDVMTND